MIVLTWIFNRTVKLFLVKSHEKKFGDIAFSQELSSVFVV